MNRHRSAWAGLSAATRDRWVGTPTFKLLAAAALVGMIVGLVMQKWIFTGIMAAVAVASLLMHFVTNAISDAAGRRARGGD